MSVTMVDKKMTEQEAVELAKEIERTESALKLMKAELKKYVEENGEVNTGDKIWGFSESVSWKFSPEGLKKVFENIFLDGKDPWKYLNISASNLKKLGWSEEVLSRYGEKRVSTPFKSRKAK